ncbi:MAG: TonB-dependent receptor, partial [Gallionella sp.]
SNGKAFNKLALQHIGNHFTNSVGTAGNIYLEQNLTMLREQINLPFNDDHELSLAANLNHQVTHIEADTINATCTQFNPDCDISTAPRLQLTDQIIANGWDISAQDRKKLTPRLTLVSGLRHSSEDYLHRKFTEPRIGLEWQRTENTLLTAGWGLHNQLPTGQEIAKNFGNPQLDHLRAQHSVVGIAQKLPNNWSWKAETYYKKLTNIIINDPIVNYTNQASGKAYGAELLIKKASTEKLSGWLSVSLSKSQRRNDITGESFRFEYDQPVNATLVTTYQSDLAGILFSAKWNYHSGAPYTPIYGTNGTFPDGRPKPVYGAVNSGTLPAYHRLDLRLDRKFVYKTWKLNTYFELNNAYQRQNVVDYSYDPSYTKRTDVSPFVIPFNFGVQAEF